MHVKEKAGNILDFSYCPKSHEETKTNRLGKTKREDKKKYQHIVGFGPFMARVDNNKTQNSARQICDDVMSVWGDIHVDVGPHG